MRWVAVLVVAAGLCAAAQVDDHAILKRMLEDSRTAQVETDLYGGKAAVYRPLTLDIRIDSVAGEGCESRLTLRLGARVIDWRRVQRIDLREDRIWIVSGDGAAASKLIVSFTSIDKATSAARAMERLQVACRPKADH